MMKRFLTLSVAIAAVATPIVAPTAAGAQTRTVTTAEKQRLIEEAKQHNIALAQREKDFYASQERLNAQLRQARDAKDYARVTELQKQVAANAAQRERQRQRNADYQQHIKNVYALQTSD